MRIQIKGFQAVPAGSTVKVVLTLATPNQSGVSESLILTTYSDPLLLTSVIDQEASALTMMVSTAIAETDSSYALGNPVAAGTGLTDYTLRLKASVILDRTLTFQFRDLTIQSAGFSCDRVTLVLGVTTYTPYACSYVAPDKLAIDLSSSPIPASVFGELRIANLVNSPSIAK